MILLSVLAFSGSTSAHTDTRKPADNETTSKRNPACKRNVSFHHARQHLIAAEFYRQIGLVNLTNSLLQVDRSSHISLQLREKEKPDPLKISPTLQLHAPRSADDLVTFS